MYPRWTAVLALVTLALGLVGCGGGPAKPKRGARVERHPEAQVARRRHRGDADDDDAPTAITPGTTTPDTGATGTTASDSGAAGTTTSPEGAATPADTSGESSDDSSDGTDSTP